MADSQQDQAKLILEMALALLMKKSLLHKQALSLLNLHLVASSPINFMFHIPTHVRYESMLFGAILTMF